MRWTMRLLYAFYPRRCIYCHRVIAAEEQACKECAPKRPYIEEPVCFRCGRSRADCTCKKRRRAYERCICAMRYTEGAKEAVLRLKCEDDADLVYTMAQEMVHALRVRTDAAALDVVTCVPMHKNELSRRGYNQSELLAKAIAKELAIPYEGLLKKILETDSQKSLSRVERSGNLLGAFDVCGKVNGRRVLLADDVITTGSTLHEVSKMLTIYGAESITALTFAGSVKKDEDDEEPTTEYNDDTVAAV